MMEKRVGNTVYRSILHEMTQTTPTALWNDSSSIEELSWSISQGAVGATCNPVIVGSVLKQEWDHWKVRIPEIIRELPVGTEDEIAWRLVEEMSTGAASLLKPVFDRENGRNGRLSIQTDPRLYRDPERLLAQAEHFNSLAPNMIIKIPAIKAGLEAIEAATYRGISINATVSFTLPQAIAVAEAVERGLVRREREGKDISTMGPVCTIMVGRLDDWLRTVTEKENIIPNPGILEWAGVSVMKKAYKIYRERGYRLRLLSAAFRNHLHWSEFIGGDVVISPPAKWQKRYNASGIAIEDRMEKPVNPDIIAELEAKYVDFRRSYHEDGMKPEEFDEFGATKITLRQFCQATTDLIQVVRDIMLK
jgi:transaldolase